MEAGRLKSLVFFDPRKSRRSLRLRRVQKRERFRIRSGRQSALNTDSTPENHMKNITKPLVLSVCFFLASAGAASAANVHESTGMKGQPSQTCGSQMTGSATPGNTTSTSTSKGSPFGSTAFSATRYSGSGFQTQSSTNPKSVSQYDVACFQLSH
jgi:hypothetical protein